MQITFFGLVEFNIKYIGSRKQRVIKAAKENRIQGIKLYRQFYPNSDLMEARNMVQKWTGYTPKTY